MGGSGTIPRANGRRAEAGIEAFSLRMDKLVRTLGITGLSKSKVSEMAQDLDEQVAAFRSRPPPARRDRHHPTRRVPGQLLQSEPRRDPRRSVSYEPPPNTAQDRV